MVKIKGPESQQPYEILKKEIDDNGRKLSQIICKLGNKEIKLYETGNLIREFEVKETTWLESLKNELQRLLEEERTFAIQKDEEKLEELRERKEGVLETIEKLQQNPQMNHKILKILVYLVDRSGGREWVDEITRVIPVTTDSEDEFL